VPVPVVVEFIAGTAGLSAGIGAMEAKMAGLKLSSEASMANVAKLGVGLSAVVAAGAAVVAVESIKMAGDFQQSVVKLETTAGELKSNLDLVANGMLDMAGKVGISANDLAKGMYTIESAGFRGADALNVLKASAQGAQQEQADLGKVTDAVSTALRDYHLPASDAQVVTSQLVTAVSHGKTTFDALTGSLHSVTPIASAAGISLADATGVLSSMTASGMSADQAAQNLGATIGRLAAPTQPMIKELGALGINAAELSKNLGTTGVSGAMQEVAQAILTKMGPAGTTLLDTFNQSTQAGTNAQKMFEGMPPALQKVAEQYKSGQLDLSQYRKEIKGVPGDQRMLINSWKLMEDRANGFSQALKSGSNDSQTYISALKQATGGQEGLTVALQTTGENAAATNATIRDIANASAQADGNIKGWSEVQGNFNQKMAELKETIGALVIRLGQQLLPVVSAVADGLMRFISFAQDHQGVLAALAAVVGGALIVALSALSVALWGIATNPVVLIVAAIVVAVGLLGFAIYKAYTQWDESWARIKEVAGMVAAFFVDRWNSAWATVKGALEAIASFFVDRWNSAWASTRAGLNAIGAFFTDRWNSFYDTVARVFGAIAGFFGEWWPLLLAVFATPVFLLLALWNSFHDVVWAVVTGVWNAIMGYLSGAWDIIVSVAQAAWALFEADVVNPLQRTWATIVGIWDGVMTYLAGVWASVTSGVSDAWNAVYAAVSAAISAVLSFIEGVGGSILDSITLPFRQAYDQLTGLASSFYDIGSAIVHGVIGGIENAAGALFSTLGKLASGALNAAKSAIGISSPSRAFSEQVGGPISEGIAVGINASAHHVDKALAGVIKPRAFDLGATFTSGGGPGGTFGASGVGGAGSGASDVHVHFHAPVYGGPQGMQEVAQVVRAELLRDGNRNGYVGLR
jgi:TP901 family phage tail tape measure protein